MYTRLAHSGRRNHDVAGDNESSGGRTQRVFYLYGSIFSIVVPSLDENTAETWEACGLIVARLKRSVRCVPCRKIQNGSSLAPQNKIRLSVRIVDNRNVNEP